MARTPLHHLLLILAVLLLATHTLAADDLEDLDLPAHLNPNSDDTVPAHLQQDVDIWVSLGGFARDNLYWILPSALFAITANFLFMMHSLGSLQREEHVIVRAAKFNSPSVEAVWRAVCDWEAHPGWRGDVKRVKVLSAAEREKRVIETTWIGDFEYEVVEEEKHVLLVREIVSTPATLAPWYQGGHFFGGRWTIEFDTPKSGSGCIIYVTEQGIVRGTVVRMLNSLWGFHGPVESFLRNLAGLLGDKEMVIIRPDNGKLVVE
ncbi:hypothetical protein BDK51DRAFT_16609 [Blyttiomyces helicus]|uniref:Coenzyme Q-binding protein COQ10 START domain-containing protein n=1 Tax=Blyttiomyces helicus TaxID=388810 RepID=A0A4P9WAZ6_9FUNG|nr:hypothetical protein BDK51DRAFT_16609 [Blyttiomyces helicus]|eukprot:RKO88755.1 hypothetical protein BDK51DRAFT_16609 [Blyttiomyces helicus]